MRNIIDQILVLACKPQPLSQEDKQQLELRDQRFAVFHFQGGFPAVEHDPHVYSLPGCRLPYTTDCKTQAMTVYPTNDWKLQMRKFQALAADAKKPKRRRRQSARKPSPLTPKQTEAMYLYAEHKENFTAAAKEAGISRTAMKKLFDKACKKLGRKAMKAMPKGKTQGLPLDHRGQVNLADETD